MPFAGHQLGVCACLADAPVLMTGFCPHLRIVESRWAMTIEVRPPGVRSGVLHQLLALGVEAEVARSRIEDFGILDTARAMGESLALAAESFEPQSPMWCRSRVRLGDEFVALAMRAAGD